MRKTARDVIAECSLGPDDMAVDHLIASLDAAGFVIAPKAISTQPSRTTAVAVSPRIGGTITAPAAEVDFSKTYTFESVSNGVTYTWTGVIPTRDGDVAVFDLAYQDVRS